MVGDGVRAEGSDDRGSLSTPTGSTTRATFDAWPEQVDVLVVGAGPAGSAAAISLAKAGRNVIMVDKAVFPRDKCCGDGLTTGALRRLEALGLDPSTVPSWQWIDTVMIAPATTKAVQFPLPHDGHFAAIATRVDLDAALVDLAKLAGVTVLEGSTVTSVAQYRTEVHVTLDGAHTIAARAVIAADGMWSPVRKMLSPLGSQLPGSADSKPYLGEWHAMRQYFSGVTTPESKRLWVWFEPDLAPGYVWCFPLAGDRVNFGFGVERRDDTKTRTMKTSWESIVQRPHIAAVLGPGAIAEDSPKAWPIPANPTTASLTDGRVLYVGDAARACDVLTGEGIGQALQTGILAADALVAHPDDPRAAAKQYDEDARAELVPDHRMASTLSKMLRNRHVCNVAVAICGATNWTRRNFVRWLFEDYARGIALTPFRWRWGLMSGEGAYKASPPAA